MAILGGVGVLACGVMAAIHWNDILVGYHGLRIEGDPRRFLTAAEAPEGSPAREAARRFIAREGSLQRVLDALHESQRGTEPPGASLEVEGGLQKGKGDGDTGRRRD